MDIHLSIPLLGGWLLLTLVIQTALDLFYTRKILVKEKSSRPAVLFTASTIAMFVIGLALRLIQPQLGVLIRWARDDSGVFGIWILVFVICYGILGGAFAAIRGYIVAVSLLDSASRERSQAWWSYVFVGSVATVLLAAPVFFISLLLPAMFSQ